jgi:hypothetical protein
MPETAPTMNRTARDTTVPNSSATPWLRWLGPISVLLIGAAYFAMGQTQKPSPPVILQLCRLADVAPNAEVPFLVRNDVAMTAMMTTMTIKPSGDVDHDFVEMMVPHHQGAIDMAQALLRYGHNERLRRMAQEIIVTQQQEIAAMRLALGEALPPSLAAPDQHADWSAAAQDPIVRP